MNYHSDEWIMAGVQRHYDEVLKHYRPEQIVFVFYTGSANYNADYENSDIDTWAVVIEDDYSEDTYTTNFFHFNNEVIFFCDIRAYINGIYHSDWTYLPGLYTKSVIINPQYKDLVHLLKERREDFAYNDVPNSVQCAKTIIFHQHGYRFFHSRSDYFYGKSLYSCLLNLIYVNIYKYHEVYSSCFYNDKYGVELLKVKTGHYSYAVCKRMLFALMQEVENFNPTYEEYPRFKDLLSFVQNIKIQFIERYNNGYSDKN